MPLLLPSAWAFRQVAGFPRRTFHHDIPIVCLWHSSTASQESHAFIKQTGREPPSAFPRGHKRVAESWLPNAPRRRASFIAARHSRPQEGLQWACHAVDVGKPPTVTTAQGASSASDQLGASKPDPPRSTQESPTMAQSAVPSASSGATSGPTSLAQKLAEVLSQSDKSILKGVEFIIGRPCRRARRKAQPPQGPRLRRTTPSVTPAALPATPMSRKGAETERSRSLGTRSLHTASDAQPSHLHTAVRDLETCDRSRDQQDGTRKLARRARLEISERSLVDQSNGEWGGAGTDSEGDGQDDNGRESTGAQRIVSTGSEASNYTDGKTSDLPAQGGERCGARLNGEEAPTPRETEGPGSNAPSDIAGMEDDSKHAAAPAVTTSRSKKRRLSAHSETDSRGEHSKKHRRDREALSVRGAADEEASLPNSDSNGWSLRGGGPGEPPTGGVVPPIGIRANSPGGGGGGATTTFRPTTASTTARGTTSRLSSSGHYITIQYTRLGFRRNNPAASRAGPRFFGEISGSDLALTTKYLNVASAEELVNFYGGGDSVLLSDGHLGARPRLVLVLWCEHESPEFAPSLRDPV
ncbi:hypothetical protein DL771_000508 [Monosporascus sp. 5C6A]|nr:hypothetical protein DL771_000508 [Monosporascus sp. 5C6A]